MQTLQARGVPTPFARLKAHRLSRPSVRLKRELASFWAHRDMCGARAAALPREPHSMARAIAGHPHS